LIEQTAVVSSSRQGQIGVAAQHLQGLFGKPSEASGDKINNQYVFGREVEHPALSTTNQSPFIVDF